MQYPISRFFSLFVVFAISGVAIAADNSSPSVPAPSPAQQSAQQNPATAQEPVAYPLLDKAQILARNGALKLALDIITQHQPPFAEMPRAWLAWEQEHLYLLERSGEWQRLVDRLATLPAGLPLAFMQSAALQHAAALLKLEQPASARLVLQPVLWNAADNPIRFRQARELVIHSYVLGGALTDANAAIRRYLQDYSGQAVDRESVPLTHWRILQARLYLQSGQAAQALTSLRDIASAEAKLLSLLARLRLGDTSPGAVMEKAVALAVAKSTPEEQQRLAWAVAAETAGLLGNYPAQISSLERAIPAPDSAVLVPVVKVSADTLWQAYLTLGKNLGNQLRLVVGDDQAWFLAASNRYDKQPIHARALFAVVAFNALQPEQRDVAHWQFASLLKKSVNGDALLNALYLDSRRFSSPDDIPPPVRYLLVDYVLSQSNIVLASTLMAGLNEPPKGADPATWHLRRARVLLLGGNIESGIKALDTVMALETPPATDHLLQVLFDLQTMGLNKAALHYFLQLLATPELLPEKRREIIFWAADSYKALGDYRTAAEFYLASATLLDPVAMDPWAQTARYQAANALVKAGYTADAKRLYSSLLGATQDPARRAVLRREIQQLDIKSDK